MATTLNRVPLYCFAHLCGEESTVVSKVQFIWIFLFSFIQLGLLVSMFNTKTNRAAFHSTYSRLNGQKDFACASQLIAPMWIWVVKLPSVAVARLLLLFYFDLTSDRSWTARNQSLGRLSKHQNLQQERCIEL